MLIAKVDYIMNLNGDSIPAIVNLLDTVTNQEIYLDYCYEVEKCHNIFSGAYYIVELNKENGIANILGLHCNSSYIEMNDMKIKELQIKINELNIANLELMKNK